MTPELPAVLYHYTCGHGLRGITADRALTPNPHPLLGHPLVWLTDLPTPDRHALGLTSDTLLCDRTEHRADVIPGPDVQWWPHWAHKARIPGLIREILEGGGGQPTHWWVASVNVSVLAVHPRRALRSVSS